MIVLKSPALSIEYILKFALSSKLPLGEKLKDAKWNLSLTTLDLDKIKRIRNVTKAHFNIICSMRTYFLESKRVENVSYLPRWTWVFFPVGLPGHPAMTNGGGGEAMTNHMYECNLSEHNSLNTYYVIRLNYITTRKLSSQDVCFHKDIVRRRRSTPSTQ
jgi:hypothetical protein